MHTYWRRQSFIAPSLPIPSNRSTRCLEAALLFEEGIARLKAGAASPAIAALKTGTDPAAVTARPGPVTNRKTPSKEKRAAVRKRK
jgi:hypothetical protein